MKFVTDVLTKSGSSLDRLVTWHRTKHCIFLHTYSIWFLVYHFDLDTNSMVVFEVIWIRYFGRGNGFRITMMYLNSIMSSFGSKTYYFYQIDRTE